MKRILDIQTPVSLDIAEFVDEVAKRDDFDAVMVEERGGASALMVAKKIREAAAKEVYLKIACCDRNRIALRSELVTAASTGLLNLVLVDGVHPIHTPFPDAKPVFDLDALGLLRLLRGESPGLDADITSLLSSLSWRIGVAVGGITTADIVRAKSFLATGIDLLFVPTVTGVSALKKLTDVPIILMVSEEDGRDLAELVREAESAGAEGVSVTARMCRVESA